MAKMKRIPKSANGPARWKTMSRDTKRKKIKPWCVFYTPLGRMVTKAVGRRPTGMSEEEFCASKTPFKNMVIKRDD